MEPPSAKLLQSADNKYKSNANIVLQVTNFKEFAQGPQGPQGPGLTKESDEFVYINGLPWKIVIKRSDTCIGFFVKCCGDLNDLAWYCKAKLKLKIVSWLESGGFPMERECPDFCFNAIDNEMGLPEFVKIEELMDEKKGFFKETENAVLFNAHVTVKEPRAVPGVRFKDTLLVHGKVVYVNKYLLATCSEHFKKFFFENPEEELKPEGVEDAAAHFERLMCTMFPQNQPLDDDCVEGVLVLAHQYLIDDVENRCVAFLKNESKKTAICKFRLAHQCHYVGLKKHILKNMTKEDFSVSGQNYMANLFEDFKMSEEAVDELGERHTELFRST
uniref:BTB domain-containing protein n=1 Tax=Globodera rostochiensis TaxID=31243 RepID=A0A914GTK9_GLORO